MTVATDLATAYGIYRNVYIKIDGIPAIFWRANNLGELTPPAGYTTYSCLQDVEMGEIGISFQDATTQLSAISFKLIDFLEGSHPHTTPQFYLAKLFAPNGWYTGNNTQLAAGTTARQFLDADSTYIYTADASGLASSGTAYLGRETFSYSGKSSNTLTGCTRGLYPAVTNAVAAYTNLQPRVEDSEVASSVSDAPYSIIGRRVAVYVTTWDYATGAWIADGSSQLLWVGRISDRVIWEDGVWTISCESILKDLDKEIAVNLASSPIEKICIPANFGRKFVMTVESGGYQYASRTIDPLPAGDFYGTLEDLIAYVNAELASQDWTLGIKVGALTVGPHFRHLPKQYASLADTDAGAHGKFIFDLQDGIVYLRAYFTETAHKTTVTIKAPDDDKISFVLYALGWGRKVSLDLTEFVDENDDLKLCKLKYSEDSKPYYSFYPVKQMMDLPVKDVDEFFDSQGDSTNWDGNACGYLKLSGFRSSPWGEDEGNVYLSYYGSTANGLSAISYYYTKIFGFDEFAATDWIICGSKDPENPIFATQVYIPDRSDGPFKQLLYPLLSTGTTDYNNAIYDKLPPELSIGIPDEIVDIQSFLDADSAIAQLKLTQRGFYEIKANRYIDIIRRELLLFGYALVWNNSKLTVKKISPPEIEKYSTTIDNDVLIQKPQIGIEYSTDTVINSYSCEYNYDIDQEKYLSKIIINDGNSIAAYGKKGEIGIAHPALVGGRIPQELQSILANRFYSLAAPRVKVVIAPTLINQIYAGDVIYFDSAYTPSIFGDGTMTTQTYAFVESVIWNLSTWIGECSLVLLPDGIYHARLGPSALVSGWDDGTYRFTLANLEFGIAGDADDGARFLAGDLINVIERAPSDPTSPQSYGPLTVASNYETDGAGLLSLSGTPTLTAWDAGKEYIITYADYSNCQTSQTTAAFLAAETSKLIAAGVKAKKWQ